MAKPSIYDYLEDAERSIRPTALRFKNGCEVSLVLNSVAEMYNKYNDKVKSGGTIHDVQIRDNLMSLWTSLETISRKHSEMLTRYMTDLRDADYRAKKAKARATRKGAK